MRFKKAQTEIREMLLTIVMAGILFIIGLLIFTNVSNTTSNILDSDVTTITNESITMTTSTGTVINESIAITDGIGTAAFSGIASVTFFGAGNTSTHSGDTDVGLEVNFTRAGTITVDTINFSNGNWNISYTFEQNTTGTTANDEVSAVAFFGNADANSTHTTGIEIDDEVNFTSVGVISAAAENFTSGTYNITYTFSSDTSAQTTISNLETTVLDSFSLGVIALIVLAAVVILGVLFKLSTA